MMSVFFIFIFWCLLVLPNLSNSSELTNDFAVELHEDGDRDVAELIAAVNGFKIVRQLEPLGNVYHFQHKTACHTGSDIHRCKREANDILSLLQNDPNVVRVEHQEVLDVDKREFIEDDLLNMLEEEKITDKELDELYKKGTDNELEVDMRSFMKSNYKVFKKAIDERKKKLPKFNDPMFPQQWHLDNHGQMNGINPGLDLNVAGAWNQNYTGNGVVVSVVDDGIDISSPDLSRYDPLASADLNNLSDPIGLPQRPHLTQGQSHGTKCAGEIGAAANNKFCGVGVAFNAKLGGIRVLDGPVTDLLEAYSLLHNNQYVDIYSCSWGPKDNGFAMDKPKYYTSKALTLGVTKGRHGLGSIFVYASGNGGNTGDNCGADGFVNSPYTIAAGAMNIYGQNPFYGEACAAIHVAAPVGGYHSAQSKKSGLFQDFKVITSDINHACTKTMSGTSAATPLVAACVALALEANPKLTWRDVQHVLVRSARLPSPRARMGWQRNAAGFLVSHHFGFGLLDCSRLVSLAQTWVNVQPQHNCSDAALFSGKKLLRISEPVELKFKSSGCQGKVTSIEHVVVTLTFTHVRRGDLEIWLMAPSGIKARLLGSRPLDKAKITNHQSFLSLFSWGESPVGVWTLVIKDTGKSVKGFRGRKKAIRGSVTYASITFLGSTVAPIGAVGNHGHNPDKPGYKGHRPGSYWVQESELKSVFAKQRVETAQLSLLNHDTARVVRKLASNPLTALSETEALVKRQDISDDDLRYLLSKLDSQISAL